MEHGDRDDPSNKPSSSSSNSDIQLQPQDDDAQSCSTSSSGYQSEDSSANEIQVDMPVISVSNEESREEVTSHSCPIIGTIRHEKRPRDGCSGDSKKSKKKKSKSPSSADQLLETGLGPLERARLVGKAKVEDARFVEDIIDALIMGDVDRVKHRTSTIKENKKELFQLTVRFLHNLHMQESLDSVEALKEEVLTQQKYVDVLTHDKEKLRCDVKNLKSQLETAKVNCHYLEKDLAAKDEQLVEVTRLAASRKELLEEADVAKNKLQGALDAANEREGAIVRDAVEGLKRSSEFAAILAAERAAELARFKQSAEFGSIIDAEQTAARTAYLAVLKSRQWLKVNKIAKDINADVVAKMLAQASKTSESTSAQQPTTSDQPPVPEQES